MALAWNTGMTSIASADSTSNYSAVRFSGSGAAPGVATADDFVEGTAAVQSKLQGNGWNSAVLFDYYTANGSTVLNLTTTGNEVLAGWFRYGLVSQTLTVASGGMYLLVQSSSETGTSVPTVWSEWYLGGSDFYPVSPNGWYFFALDTRKTVSATGGGGASLSTVRRIGIGIRNIASGVSNKGEPFYLDAMWYGRPNYRVTGDGSTVAAWSDFITHSGTTQVNGLIQDIGGAYHVRCGIQFGNAAQSATTTFLDATGKQMIFKRVRYYQGGLVDALNYSDYYTVQGVGAASFRTSITFGSVVGTGDDRQGVLGGAMRAEDSNVTWDVDFQTDKTDLSAVKLYGLDIVGAQGGVLLDNNSGGTETTLASVAFVNCGLVDPGTTGGGAEMLNFAVIDPLGATNNRGLRLRSGHNIKQGSFITSGSPTTQTMTYLDESPGAPLTITSDALSFFGDYSSATIYQGEATGTGTYEDNYASSNNDGSQAMYSGSVTRVAQTFTASGGTVYGARFQLSKTGSPTGNVTVSLYATSGGAPTGAALASGTFPAASLTGSLADYDIEFAAGVGYLTTTSVVYALAVEFSGGDVSNAVNVGWDTSSPSHGGTGYTYNGSWSSSANDVGFGAHNSIVILSATNGSNPDDSEFTATASTPALVAAVTSVPVQITVQEADGTKVSGAQCSVFVGGVEVMNTDSNGSGIASSTYGGSTPTTGDWRVRKSSPGDTKYYPASGSESIASGTGMSITVVVRPDPNNNS